MKNNSGKTILSGIIWKTGERILAQSVSFIVSLVLARLLAPDDYGVVAMVLVFISLADVFVTSGFSTSLIQSKDAGDLEFSTIFYCSLFVAVLLYCLLFFLAPFISVFYKTESLTVVIRVFALRIPASVYNSIQHAFVSRHMLFKRFFWSTLIGTIISGIVGIVFAYLGFGVWALIFQYFANTIIDTFVLAVTVPWHPRKLFSWDKAKLLMNYGWKILIADLSGTFFLQLRSLIIGRVYSKSDLAYYNKGQQIPSLIFNNIGSSTMTVLFPAISNASDDLVLAKKMTIRAMKLMTYSLFPVFLGIAAVSPELIRVLLTSKWDSSIPFTQILCVSYAFATLGIAPFQSLKAIGKSDVVLRLEFWKKPVYVLLLIVGVRISTLAIAFTMALYDIYGTIVNCFNAQKYINYSIKEQVNDIIPASGLTVFMAIIVYFIRIPVASDMVNLLIKVAIGVLIYVLGSILLKIDSFYYLKNLLLSFIKKSEK